MKLATAAPSPASTAATVGAGFRISTDGEFSAPRLAQDVRPLLADNLAGAIVEARSLVSSGALDAAAAAVVLQNGRTFSAGRYVEMDPFTSRITPANVPHDNAQYRYSFEPAVAAIVGVSDLRIVRR